MKRLLVSLVAMVAVAASAVAGEVYARQILTLAGATNTSWTVGKYDRPTIVRIDTIGMLSATSTGTVTVVYGDDAGSTNTICVLTNSGGVASQSLSPSRYLQAGDVLWYGAPVGTNGSVRIHYIQRDTRTIN